MTFVLVLFLWVFSVCLHEFAHALAAYHGGDTSVREKGYLSMNPVKYLDPLTSVILPVLFLILGGLGLPGAAVYIERHRLRSHHIESAVSLAGPAANLVLLVILGLLLQTGIGASAFAPALAFLGLLQASAVVLNLLPLPGLDGYGALSPYLPPNVRANMDRFALHGILLLVALMFLVPPFARLFWSVVWLLAHAFGIPIELALAGYQEFRFWE
jgi:Zn-dependent protease